MHMAAEGGCTAAADLRAVSTATNSRLRNSVSIGDAMGPKAGVSTAVCIVRGEQFLVRNETIWVHVRHCLLTCNRTKVRPAPTDRNGQELDTRAF